MNAVMGATEDTPMLLGPSGLKLVLLLEIYTTLLIGACHMLWLLVIITL